MKQNLASWDRVVRAIAGGGMFVCSIFAPLPIVVRVLVLGGGGAYLLETALVGTCFGYKLMGISTLRSCRSGALVEPLNRMPL